MKIIELEREDLYRGSLLLVNAGYPLRNKRVENLTSVDTHFPNILMRINAADALKRILRKIDAGSSIVPVSGYRSAEEQTDIYNSSLRENGKDFTKKYVALPDSSEHQTGLAIDLGLNKEEIDFIRPDFPYDGICGEFRKAAPDYGFIEHYAGEKEKITGIAHEPWHFRYVGYPHSKIMAQNGFCLEEYIEFIRDFRENCRFPFYTTGNCGRGAEIYFVPAKDEKTMIAVPETQQIQISGNNVDGFIVMEER